LAAIFLRLWYLQVVKGDELSERARFFRNTAVSRPAPRGIVFDRKGRVLAGVRSVYVVTAIPAIVRKNDWVLGKIAEMLGTDEQKLADRVKDAAWRPYLPATIMVNVGVQIASRIAELGADLPGIGIESQPMRTYPDPKTFAHVLGYVWTPNENDVARLADLDVKPAAYVGKLGIEYVYEKDLMGAAGQERLEVDAKRRPVRLVGRDNAVPGAQAILSIDAELQRLAVEQLGGRPGAVVAIDPNNGEVLCLASSPTYDASLFDGGISHADWERLSDNPDRPLLNRAASASYAPGSAFKLVVSLAAMRKGTFDPNRTFYCPGYYTVGNRKSKCLGQHGSISYHEALTKSCNTYFSDLAVRTGADAIRDEAIACGFNSQTLVDLRSESRGLVPTEEWIDKHRKPPQWYAGDTVNLGIGQGELRATPLQMANLVALVATRGRQYQPHLMHALRRPGAPAELTQPAMLHQVDAPEAFWDELTSAMADVTRRGGWAWRRCGGACRRRCCAALFEAGCLDQGGGKVGGGSVGGRGIGGAPELAIGCRQSLCRLQTRPEFGNRGA
ncbi:MAG: penicillin-binding protein 2, partial [Fimbriimonas ginsengisoli]|nr:penicillin-binding protein 2 [Fimbriimonas ginsengisoli]